MSEVRYWLLIVCSANLGFSLANIVAEGTSTQFAVLTGWVAGIAVGYFQALFAEKLARGSQSRNEGGKRCGRLRKSLG